MTDQIVFFQRKDHVQEKSQYVVTATFRDRATAADVTPTNVRYRVDIVGDSSPVLDWTTATAASTVTLTITPTQNTLRCGRDEVRELVVAADYGLSTQYVESVRYTLENLQGVT